MGLKLENLTIFEKFFAHQHRVSIADWTIPGYLSRVNHVPHIIASKDFVACWLPPQTGARRLFLASEIEAHARREAAPISDAASAGTIQTGEFQNQIAISHVYASRPASRSNLYPKDRIGQKCDHTKIQRISMSIEIAMLVASLNMCLPQASN